VFYSSTVFISTLGLIFNSYSVKTGSSGFFKGSSASVLMILTILVMGFTIIDSVLLVINTDPIHMIMQVNNVIENPSDAVDYAYFLMLNLA
jgi:hypothetical protein